MGMTPGNKKESRRKTEIFLLYENVGEHCKQQGGAQFECALIPHFSQFVIGIW